MLLRVLAPAADVELLLVPFDEAGGGGGGGGGGAPDGEGDLQQTIQQSS